MLMTSIFCGALNWYFEKLLGLTVFWKALTAFTQRSASSRWYPDSLRAFVCNVLASKVEIIPSEPVP